MFAGKMGNELMQDAQDLTDLVIGQLITDGSLRQQARVIVEGNKEDYSITGLRSLFIRYMSERVERLITGQNIGSAFTTSFLTQALNLVDWYQVITFLAPSKDEVIEDEEDEEEEYDGSLLSAKNLAE